MTKLECLIGLLNTIPLNNIKTSLPLDLLHHFKYLTIASVNKDLIYLTTPSGHPFDACFVDKQTETIMCQRLNLSVLNMKNFLVLKC